MAKKPTKKRKAGGGGVLGAPEVAPEYDVFIGADGEMPEQTDATQPIEVQFDDGSVEIDLNPQPEEEKEKTFGDNLAEKIGADILGNIAMTLLEAIEEDVADRAEWLQQRADGLELLGMKIEKSGGSVGSAGAAVAGQIMVRDPILAEAIDRFQANAYAELCPSNGPVKAVNFGPSTADSDKLAKDFAKDFNFYLASGADGTATEYYPDTRQMLWWVGYASGMFKKVYRCPLRQRPVSESVDGEYLIIPSNVSDLQNAGRITHEIRMRQSVMKRMQIAGAYRDVPLQTPNYTPNVIEQAKDDVAGLGHTQGRDEDEDYTVYEVYCELNIPGFEHKDKKGNPTGLPLPYRVAIEKDSRVVLEVRRNWDEDDEDMKAKIPFILFPYATGLSIYGTGLLQRLGNPAIALTAMERELIDAGMFASFPGFLYAKPAGRQLQSDFRVPPGGGAPIDVSATQNDISKAVMPLPYKDPSGALVTMRQQIREEAFRFGNMADMPVGEGKQDAPVGTTLALIEQGTKVIGGILKDLHNAQKRELNMLKELFREDPEALWRGNERSALGPDKAQRMERWKQALETCEIVPASDPNVPSDMHRAAKAQMLKQLTMGNPAYDQIAVDRRICEMFNIDDFDALLNPNAPAPDPMMVAQVQMKAKELQLKEQKMMMDAQNAQRQVDSREQIEAMKIAAKGTEHKDPFRSHELSLKNRALSIQEAKMVSDSHNAHADRQSREAIEAMKVASTVGVHPEANEVVDEQLAQMRDFLSSGPTTAAPMAAGGAVNGEILPPEDNDIDLAVAITQFLRDWRPQRR
ncbi:MAG: hypothetical protein E6R03_06040 [Hyphomicrobiaceae bacterium]|nr:MAG: hypothetical protein E6R03_06040 [Hyphomicrobiaceae bacterium]